MLDKVDAVNVSELMADIGRRARAATRTLATAPAETKNAALKNMAAAMRAATPDILAANAIDVATMKANGQTDAFLDRGTLTAERVEAIAKALEDIAELDPHDKQRPAVRQLTARGRAPLGLDLGKARLTQNMIADRDLDGHIGVGSKPFAVALQEHVAQGVDAFGNVQLVAIPGEFAEEVMEGLKDGKVRR